MLRRLRERNEWRFFASLTTAAPGLGVAWWALVVLRGLLPAGFAVAMGVLVAAVRDGDALGGSLALVGVLFVLQQVLVPAHDATSANLGDRTSAWLHDELTAACLGPPGMGHLEDPALADDLSVARDFDLGMLGPPLHISMDFIAQGLVQLVAGLASATILVAYRWWAPLVIGGAWLSTHWLLRESSVWRDRNTEEVRRAQRDADYAYRLAVDPPAAKELRLFGLAGWVMDRFVARRTRLHELQFEATRLRERSIVSSVVLVVAANGFVLWSLADAAASGDVGLPRLVVFAGSVVGASAIAFGGLNWALDGAAAPVGAVLRLRGATAARGALPLGAGDVGGRPAVGIRFRDVTFRYPSASDGSPPVLEALDLEIPAGTSLAVVGVNGAGKTTLAKLLCRLYDPTEGAIEVDGDDLRGLDLEAWRGRVTAVFQDFVRYELTLRENVAPLGAPDDVVRAALEDAGASTLADLDTVLSRAYANGTDLSGGQWQRVALARALCAVRLGAGLVILDEPTAQLDVRGEAEIFDRILSATRSCTTILVSHRFSTVRQADRICVIEHGRVVEIGSHDELMARGGRYRTMFDLQAERFALGEAEEGVTYETLG